MSAPGRVPDRVLERYRLGELPAAQAAALREAVAADSSLRERLEALDHSDREILEAYPPGPFAQTVQARVRVEEAAGIGRGSKAARTPWTAPAVAVGLLALAGSALLLKLAPVPAPESSARGTPADRSKGVGLDLLVYRRGGPAAVERLVSGALARPADVIQVAYRAGGHRYGVILSVDGRGAVTRHLPAEGEQAVPLQEGGAIALAHAYRLDDAP